MTNGGGKHDNSEIVQKEEREDQKQSASSNLAQKSDHNHPEQPQKT